MIKILLWSLYLQIKHEQGAFGQEATCVVEAVGLKI